MADPRDRSMGDTEDLWRMVRDLAQSVDHDRRTLDDVREQLDRNQAALDRIDAAMADLSAKADRHDRPPHPHPEAGTPLPAVIRDDRDPNPA